MSQPDAKENGHAGVEEECSSAAPLSCCKTFIYGLPGGALLPFTGMWALYGNKYYEEIGASLSIIMLFTAVARSFDLIADPLISYMTDTSGTGFLSCLCFRKYGRRKPWMFIGAFFMGVSVFALLSPPYAETAILSVWFGVFYVTYYVWESITAVPYNAFGAELSENSDERTGAFFMEGLFEGLGAVVMLSAPILFSMVSIPGISDQNDQVCLSKSEMANSCLVGDTCSGFFLEGFSAAYARDEDMHNLMFGTALKSVGGVIEVLDFKAQCAAWSITPDRNSMSSKVIDGTPDQNDGFCGCFEECLRACNVAENRGAFTCVSILFALYIIPTVWLSCCALHSVYDPAIHGAPPEKENEVKKAPPLVPSLMSAMENKMFRILLPTWTCDGLVQAVVMALPYYYTQAVIAPSYMTMEKHGIDCAASSPTYRNDECGGPGGQCTGLASIEDDDSYFFACDITYVVSGAGGTFLIAALMSVPFWFFLVAKIGKHKAWLLFSLSHSVAAIGFLFLGEGQYMYLWAVTALNGVPFGAKFLNDSILADIVDYDEFLTGNRKEATYFMAKSFIPKVVQIPAAVLPIAFLPAVGYIQPVQGVVQKQPETVLVYIKIISFIGVIAAAFAFFLKFKYKLRDTDLLQKSLQDIKDGREGVDPVSGMLWKPVAIETRELDEREVFYECSYFTHKSMRQFLLGEEARKSIQGKMRIQLMTSVILMGGFIAGTAGTVSLLNQDDSGNENKFSFVPTLCMIGVGLMIAVNMFTYSRYFASKSLSVKLDSQEGPMNEPQLKKQQTEDSIEKCINYTEKREKIGVASALLEDGSVLSSSQFSQASGDTSELKTSGVADGKPAPPEVALLDFTAPPEAARVMSIFLAPMKTASLRACDNSVPSFGAYDKELAVTNMRDDNAELLTDTPPMTMPTTPNGMPTTPR